MQRSLSAVVLSIVLALAPRHGEAQVTKTTQGQAGAKGAASKPAPSSAPPPAAPSDPTSARKPDDRLSDEAELARIAGLYEAGKYRECNSELERLLDPLSKAPLKVAAIVATARVYWAACLMGA